MNIYTSLYIFIHTYTYLYMKNFLPGYMYNMYIYRGSPGNMDVKIEKKKNDN